MNILQKCGKDMMQQKRKNHSLETIHIWDLPNNLKFNGITQ